MANKDIQDGIAKMVRERPRLLLDLVDAPIAAQENFSTSQAGLVQGLRFLVEDLRAQAELVMDSGARGKGAEATALRATASTLSLLADAVEKVDLDGGGEVLPQVSRGGPKLKAIWCGDQADHGPHIWPVEPDAAERYECLGRRTTDLSGLNALVTERSGVQVIHVPPGAMQNGTNVIPLSTPIQGPAVVAFEFADPAGATASPVALQAGDTVTTVRRDGELEAWLSGETSTMPPIRNDRADDGSSLVQTFGGAGQPIFTAAESAAFVTLRTNTPELKVAASDMFVDPKPLPAAPVMPGRRLDWADVRKSPTTAAPDHLSFSQGGTLDECGMQYRLQRLEPDVVSRPHWANVGGKALHAAVEWFELQAAKAPGDAVYAQARINIAGGIQKIWQERFSEAMTAQAMETPSVPPAAWKAGGRGQSEGWTWWQVEGEDMLRRYLDKRLAEVGEEHEPSLATAPDGKPMVELVGELDVEGVPYKIVIDQVWAGEGFGLEAGSLVIDDLKSGAYAPKGTYQLGGYAWYLRRVLGAEKVYGRFWDARTGKYTDPVDLLELHPWDELVVRVHGQHGKKTNLLFTPAPDWDRCGRCSVKHACPAALSRG